jgi:anaerobic magnesium-protoporphyrin IX monomethyl ester cyclase
MKLLFTHSYFLQLDPKQVAHSQPYPPLATILAAAFLRNEGYEVALFDPMFCSSPADIISQLESFSPDVLIVYDDGFNYLTKMCLSNMREAAFAMQQLAKKYNCRVIINSSDATDHYEKYLRHSADFIVIGEGEFALLDLVNALKSGTKDFKHIPGIAFLQDDKVIKTAKRGVSKNLDELPLPAWDLVDITPYRNRWIQKHGYFSINIATTRGCPYKCNWCAKPIYGNMYNMRSVDHVISEMVYLKQLFNFDHIWFCDDIFGLKRSWVEEFADKVRENDLRLMFKIQSRADLLVQEKYVESLARAGCHEVWMGAESGSQKILDAMDKGTTVEEIRTARRLLRHHGIRAAFFLQFGYPGETKADVESTINLVTEQMPDDIGISVSYPLPGTLFYENVKKDLVNKTNWTDSDELSMMFKNTYPPAYYKILHRLVHSIYRRKKAAGRIRTETRLSSKIKAAGSYCKYSITGAMQAARLKQLEGHEIK